MLRHSVGCRAALTLLLGIDPVMKDIAGASQEQALDTLEWSARALVEAALSTRASSRRVGKRQQAKRPRQRPISR
jgi:hypothetical protein